MGDFVFNDIIRSNSGEYFLRTANNVHENHIVSSFFRNGTLIETKVKPYDARLSEEALLNETRNFHEEKKAEIQSLLALAAKLKDVEQAETRNLLGLAFMRKGMYEEAVNEFEAAIVIDPENSAIYNNLGRAYLGLDRLDDAVTVLEKAVELSPHFADFHNNLGRAYLRKEMCRKAVEHFQQATEINPYYADAYYNLALAYIFNAVTREDFSLARNVYQTAMEHMEKALKIDPNYKTEDFDAAEAQLRDDNYREAFELFERARKNAARSPDLTFVLDFYLRVAHDGENMKSTIIWRHIRRLEELLKKYPNYADLYNHLGVAYVIMSKFVNHKAIQLFEKATEINPKFERARKNKRLAEYDHKGIQLLFDAIMK